MGLRIYVIYKPGGSLTADLLLPDDIWAALCEQRREGLANIVIRSFQLTNQIRNE